MMHQTAVVGFVLACVAGQASAFVAPAPSLRAASRPGLKMAFGLGNLLGTKDQATDKAVLDTTDLWLKTVTSQTPDAPEKTAALYADDAVLWGTVSEQARTTPKDIRNYFDFFAVLPGLSVLEYNPYVRVFGDLATNNGDYIFAWKDAEGNLVPKKARYSFYYRKDATSPTGWKIIDHHSSAMPTAPPGLKPALTGEAKAVLATTDLWLKTVTSQTADAPEKTAALYAPEAVLWGTVSEQVRATPKDIRDYFDFFAVLPGLSVLEYNPYVRVFGDLATNNGDYIFAWKDASGTLVPKKARYTFMYKKDPESPTGWKIIDHHSSAMPEAPPGLLPAGAA